MTESSPVHLCHDDRDGTKDAAMTAANTLAASATSTTREYTSDSDFLPPKNRRTRMRQQMAHHQAVDQSQQRWIRQQHDTILAHLWSNSLYSLGWILVLLVVFLLVFQPVHLVRFDYWFWPSQQVWPDRTIVTLYPPELNVMEQLPRFFMGYAIATPENANARAAVQAVAAQRKLVTYPGRNVQQRIRFIGWDHADFYRQSVTLQSHHGVMDHVCGGTGYQDLYETSLRHVHTMSHVETKAWHEWRANVLLQACLMRTGHADGYLSRTLHVISPIVRGWHGVAAVRHSSRRVHSDLLLLPILSRDEQRQHKPRRVPSTRVPDVLADFLLTVSTQRLPDTIVQWEEFLYQVIVDEQSAMTRAPGDGTEQRRWILWTAACHPDVRQRLHREQQQRYVATTCRNGQDPFAALSHHSNSTNLDKNESDECCSFFDPERKPFIPRRNDDEL